MQASTYPAGTSDHMCSFLDSMKVKAEALAVKMAILELSCWDAQPAKHEAALIADKENPSVRRTELEKLACGKRVAVNL